LVGTILSASVALSPSAKAQGGDADKILKAMFDYVASQKALSITFDSDIEVITPTLQKIQFTSSGQVQLNCPDKVRATRTGGYTDVEVVFDGKTLTMHNKIPTALRRSRLPDRLIKPSRRRAKSMGLRRRAPISSFPTPTTS